MATLIVKTPSEVWAQLPYRCETRNMFWCGAQERRIMGNSDPDVKLAYECYTIVGQELGDRVEDEEWNEVRCWPEVYNEKGTKENAKHAIPIWKCISDRTKRMDRLSVDPFVDIDPAIVSRLPMPTQVNYIKVKLPSPAHPKAAPESISRPPAPIETEIERPKTRFPSTGPGMDLKSQLQRREAAASKQVSFADSGLRRYWNINMVLRRKLVCDDDDF